jgi:tetratricopeptide (TPR) repeat protein
MNAAPLRQAILLLLVAMPLSAQAAAPSTVAGLGTLTFPVTAASAKAREGFLRGALLLHLFHYEEARAAFRQAEQLDPGFTMAWWGEAMAWNYGVWDEQFPDSARAALAQLGPNPAARIAKGRTARERDYLATVETLYGVGTKPHRDTVYAAAAEQLSRTYPDDDEAKLFYALALLGLNQGVRDIPTYQRALTIATDVFRRHPDHPGASHYVIHASDDPAHAALGLDAARALAKSSPAADHAQHMTSHIFMALGMWDDLVAANERATHVAAMPGMPAMKASGCGHYNEWLDYGYAVQGRVQLATQLLERCRATAKNPTAVMDMWSHYILDTEDWRSAQLSWAPTAIRDREASITYRFVRGFTAARRGALATADSEWHALLAARDAMTDDAARAHDTSPATKERLTRAAALYLELEAAIRSGEGKHEEAVTLLRLATSDEDRMAYAFGPPQIDKPSHELLGEELLLLKRPSEARTEFQEALKTTPRRPLALRGLALASERAGMPREAQAAWRELADVWHAADPGHPGLAEARRKGATAAAPPAQQARPQPATVKVHVGETYDFTWRPTPGTYRLTIGPREKPIVVQRLVVQ